MKIAESQILEEHDKARYEFSMKLMKGSALITLGLMIGYSIFNKTPGEILSWWPLAAMVGAEALILARLYYVRMKQANEYIDYLTIQRKRKGEGSA